MELLELLPVSAPQTKSNAIKELIHAVFVPAVNAITHMEMAPSQEQIEALRVIVDILDVFALSMQSLSLAKEMLMKNPKAGDGGGGGGGTAAGPRAC